MVADDRLVLVSQAEFEEESLEDDDQPCQESLSHHQPPQGLLYLASLVAALGGVLFGYDVGVIAGARSLLAKDMNLTCQEEELVVSLMPLGAVSASLVSGWLLNTLGRKYSIQLTALLFTMGALVMGMADSLVVLLVGRFMVGFCVSLSAMSECTYISEIARATHRGRLITLNELGITLGFLLAFIVNYIFMTVDSGWRYMFGLSGVVAVVQFVCMAFLPQTPHFLVIRGKEEQAGMVMKKMHGLGGMAAKREVAKIRTTHEEEKETSCTFLFSSEDNMRSRLVVGLGLVVAQQVTGQPNILYYATDIAQSVGFCGDLLSASATVLLGMVKVVATVLAMLLVDKVGRRTLLLSGVGMMVASLMCLTVSATYQEQSAGFVEHQVCVEYTLELINSTSTSPCPTTSLPSSIRYLSFAALVTYITAYSFSFGPITWVLLAELFPLNTKTQAMSLGQAVNWTVNVLVSVTFLDVVRIFTLPAVFSFYFLMSIISLLFIYFYVPETKNLTLEQISSSLKQPHTCAHKTLSPMPVVNTTHRNTNIFVPLQHMQNTEGAMLT
eukprot:TRINITY_DN4419_c0_g1_i2.p1 TRINITY_DN4419_c0_g1~~TRINITY_DN4419_c0_g1_i2.p1  ORF type:complete len:555 (-),score=184.30 TRINITY_DN4419_c0_g1_i2:132-1796(-)